MWTKRPLFTLDRERESQVHRLLVPGPVFQSHGPARMLERRHHPTVPTLPASAEEKMGPDRRGNMFGVLQWTETLVQRAPFTPGPWTWLVIFLFSPTLFSKLSPTPVTVSLKCFLVSSLPVSSCLISSLSFSQREKTDRVLCLWDIHHTRLIFSNCHCQHVTPLFRSFRSSPLPVAANINTLFLCSVLQSPTPLSVLRCISFLLLSPKGPGLLWVFSMSQPCVIYAIGLASSLALAFLLPFRILIFLGQTLAPPPF